MQQILANGLDWEEGLLEEIIDTVVTWKTHLKMSKDMNVYRGLCSQGDQGMEMTTFVDVSSESHGEVMNLKSGFTASGQKLEKSM